MDARRSSDDDVRALAALTLVGSLGIVLLILVPRSSSALPSPSSIEPARASAILALAPGDAGLAPAAPPSLAIPAPMQGSGAYASDVEDEEPDPQVLAYRRAFRGGVDGGVPQPFAIAYRRGTLVSSRGLPLARGAACEVRVMPVGDVVYDCVVRVSCGGQVLYPDEGLQAGYTRCRVEAGEAVHAEDDSSTDGDRELVFDLATRTVTVREHDGDAEVLSARIAIDG